MCMRLGVLGSTRGTHLNALLNAIAANRLSAEIAVVVSNKQEALILEKAKTATIPAIFLDPTPHARVRYDELLTACLQQHAVDYVVLIGYMRILSPAFIKRFKNRILNVHPSLLPRHAGKMDLAVHQAVIDAGETESGCTVHDVTDTVDAGPILLQKRCVVFADDTAQSLKNRVQALEGDALIEALGDLSNRKSHLFPHY